MATYEDAVKKYPDWAWAFNIPGVGEELKKGIDDPAYDPMPAIRQTDWWRQTQASVRQWDALKANDPESANARLRDEQAKIWDLRQQLGMNADPNWVQDAAEKSLRLGWSDQQINDYLVSQLSYNPGVSTMQGSVSSVMAELKASAGKYFVQLSDQTAFDYAKSILAGEHKAEDWIGIWQNQAKQQFQYAPELVNAIDKGISVDQFVDPIKQRIASILETSPDAIDMSSPKYSQALDFTDGSGKRRMMTYSEVDNLARSQPEYAKTKKAQQGAATLGETILKTFGKVA